MKRIFVTLFAMLTLTLSIPGCSHGPDFTGKCVVSSKDLDLDRKGAAIYHLSGANEGVRGLGWGAVKFVAPVSFADVGDSIMFIDGTMKVVKVDK